MSGWDPRGHPRVGQVLLTRQGISLDLLLRPSECDRKADRTFLPTSPRRREVRTISSSPHGEGWRMVSEDSHPKG